MVHDHSSEGSSTPASESPARSPVIAALTSPRVVLVIAALVTLLAMTFGGLAENRQNFDPDEAIYLRVISLFDHGASLELMKDYEGEPASPAPLFFVLYAWVGKVAGFTLSTFRAFSLLLTLAAFSTLWWFVRRTRHSDDRDHFPLLFFLFPYVFCMGFSVMAEPLTLLFGVVALCCYQRGLDRDSTALLALGALAATAALHVRIHAVFLPAALMVVLLLRRERSVAKWLCALAPLAARVPLMLLQGGLTVSRESFSSTKPELGLCPSNINFFLVWFGYLFFPLLWGCRGRHRVNLLVTLALIPFFLLAPPDLLAANHDGAIQALFQRLGVGTLTARCLIFPAWLVGAYLTVDLLQRIASRLDRRDAFPCACIVLFMLSLSFSTVAFERYYQLIVPVIVMLGIGKTWLRGRGAAVVLAHLLFLGLTAARMTKDIL